MSELHRTVSKAKLDEKYVCARCGAAFAREKELKAHGKECDVNIASRLDDVVKSMATLFSSHVEMGKKLTDVERLVKGGEPVEEATFTPEDVEGSVTLAVREDKLYKYSKTAKTYALVDVAAMISALVTRDYKALL